MTTQTARSRIDKSNLDAKARTVLDFLARKPASLFRFDVIADELKMKRGDVEKAIADLRHPRNGAPLSCNDANGTPLKTRWAFLPATSPIRADYPAIEHPAPPVQPKNEKAHKNPGVARSSHEEEQHRKNLEHRLQRKQARQAASAARVEAAATKRAERLAARSAFKSVVVPQPLVSGPVAVPDVPPEDPPAAPPKKGGK